VRTRGRKRPHGDCYTNDSYRRATARGCELAFKMPKALRRPATESAEQKQTRLAAARKWRSEHVWFPHQLRQPAATEIRKLFGLEHAQAARGHSRMDVTEIYALKNIELVAKVAREVG
jgi:site-specific recombinase XerC